MTEDSKWLEQELNLSRIVDCADEELGVDRDTITVAAPHAVLLNAHIRRVDLTRGRRRGSGRLLNFTGDFPTLHGVHLVGPMSETDFVKPGGSEGSQVEGEHGLGFSGVTQPTLVNVTVRDFYGDGIYFGSRGGSKNAKQNVGALFDGVRVWNTGRHSLSLTSMDGMRIMGASRFEFARRNPVDREIIHPVDRIRRVVIDADTVRANRWKVLKARISV